jgi:hypothetical protein
MSPDPNRAPLPLPAWLSHRLLWPLPTALPINMPPAALNSLMEVLVAMPVTCSALTKATERPSLGVIACNQLHGSRSRAVAALLEERRRSDLRLWLLRGMNGDLRDWVQ